jgi:acetate kinase
VSEPPKGRSGTMKVAVINCGSSSIKYEVFGLPDCVMLATGHIEKIGGSEGRLCQRSCKADGTFDERIQTTGKGSTSWHR